MTYDQIEEQLLLLKRENKDRAHARALYMTQFVPGPFFQRELVRQVVLCYYHDGDAGYLHDTTKLLLELFTASFSNQKEK